MSRQSRRGVRRTRPCRRTVGTWRWWIRRATGMSAQSMVSSDDSFPANRTPPILCSTFPRTRGRCGSSCGTQILKVCSLSVTKTVSFMARSHSLCLASPTRDALVTLGLVGAGATFGALAGGTALAVAVFIADHEDAGLGFIVGALFGAPVGSVVAPIVALSLLRRGALGRNFPLCSNGAPVLGGVRGAHSPPHGWGR